MPGRYQAAPRPDCWQVQASGGLLEERREILELGLDPAEDLARVRDRRLLFVRQAALGPRDGVALLVEQVPDAQDRLDVPAPGQPLARAALLRVQHRELRFPVAEHVGLDAGQARRLADAGEELVR